MIGYRFLPPAEEEVIGASLFYRAASEELGQDFLDEVQSVVDLSHAPAGGLLIADTARTAEVGPFGRPGPEARASEAVSVRTDLCLRV